MTRRAGEEALEIKSGIGKHERQPVMVRLAARWRRSNLVILVKLEKGNYLDEAYVRTGRRKALYRKERNSLKRLQKEAEIP